MATQIKIKNTHDRMTFKATFDNGDIFTFNISRSRDSYGATQLKSTPRIADADFQAICTWCNQRPAENHLNRYTRAESLFKKANSLEGLALLSSMRIEHA
jgi:hypothetical protein